MFRRMKSFVTMMMAGLLSLAAGTALAQYNPQSIGEYRDWTAWVNADGAAKVCFIASKPKNTLPKGVNRGEIYFYVTHRPSRGIEGEVAVRIGYPFDEKQEGIVRIGSREFGLSFKGDRGWPVPPSEDPRLVSAMKAGAEMTVEGLSQRGTRTKDTYSLLGFTAAYNAISKACK